MDIHVIGQSINRRKFLESFAALSIATSFRPNFIVGLPSVEEDITTEVIAAAEKLIGINLTD